MFYFVFCVCMSPAEHEHAMAKFSRTSKRRDSDKVYTAVVYTYIQTTRHLKEDATNTPGTQGNAYAMYVLQKPIWILASECMKVLDHVMPREKRGRALDSCFWLATYEQLYMCTSRPLLHSGKHSRKKRRT